MGSPGAYMQQQELWPKISWTYVFSSIPFIHISNPSPFDPYDCPLLKLSQPYSSFFL